MIVYLLTGQIMEGLKPNVLFVDDEVFNLSSFRANFRKDFNVFLADSAEQAYQVLNENEVHVVISDHRMPGKTGVEFLSSLIDKHPAAIRILLTGCSEVDIIVNAINQGQVYRYMTKPWDKEELISTVLGAFEIYQSQQQTHITKKSLEETNKQLEFMLRQKLIS